MTQLERKCREVTAHLDPIRRRAQATPAVRRATRAFRRSLTQKMFDLDPRAQAWYEGARRLGRELAAAAGEGRSERVVRELTEELAGLREKLAAVEAAAREDEAVDARRQALRRRLLAEMERLDGRVPGWIAERREIVDGLRRAGGAS